jgi:vacuole morphology and inheritance protein 14
MVPFTPRFIPAILPNLAHHVPMIQSAAIRTNKLLTKVIQDLPSPVDKPLRQSTVDKASSSSRPFTGSPTPPARQSTVQAGPSRDVSSPESMADGPPSSSASDKTAAPSNQKARAGTSAPVAPEVPSRPQSRMSLSSASGAPPPVVAPPAPPSPVPEEEQDFFDYVLTVNELTIQFLSEHEQTRVAALQWLIMLHQKAPKKVCNSG